MGKRDKGRAKVEQNIEIINKQLDRAEKKAEEATSAMSKFLSMRNVSARDANGETNLNFARGELEKQFMGDTPKKFTMIENKFTQMEEKAKAFFDSIKNGSEKAETPLSKFGKRVVGLAKRVFVFALITKAFRAMVNGLKEGLKNFAQFSKEYNKTMSDFKSQTATLKNNLATAFAPIVNAIVPYLSKLIAYLNMAIEKVSAFFSALGGKTTFTKAKKQVIDYANAVENAQNKLASFDDIQVLDSGSGGGGELTGADAFETAEIDSKISTMAEKVKAVFDDLKESMKSWWSSVDFQPLIDSFGRLKQACMPIIEGLGSGLKWLLENVLQPLGSFVIEDALPNFFDLLATAVDGCVKIFEALKPSLEFVWKNLFVPIGSFLGDVFIGIINILKDAFQSFTDMFLKNSYQVNNIITTIAKVIQLVFGIAKNVISVLGAQIKAFIRQFINVIDLALNQLSDFIDFLTGVFTGDWEKAWKSLGNIFIDIWNFLVKTVENAINHVIDILNSLSFDVPDWVPGIGGSHFGFNFDKVTFSEHQYFPKLATGGITQRPTTALIGESGREAVLPLENNTEWMDALADRIGSGNVTIKFDGSLSQLARVLKPVLDVETSRIGTTLVVE